MNDAAAEGMNEFKKFELMEINSAHIEKDSLILEDIDQLEVSTKEGRPHQISAPNLGLEIQNLNALNFGGSGLRKQPKLNSTAEKRSQIRMKPYLQQIQFWRRSVGTPGDKLVRNESSRRQR